MDAGGDDISQLNLNAGHNGTDEGTENLNISDVLEAIRFADPSFGAEASGGVAAARAPAMPHPYAELIEEPASNALRFRYECEGRSAGSLPGKNSKPENKTYPTIKIHNYVGEVCIVVSCVTVNEPYRPHPHNLVGRDRCDRGVCTIRKTMTKEDNEFEFKNLGIQCVTKKSIPKSLQKRAELKVDPFRTGFDHANHTQSIDLNAVRLAFQVFITDANGKMVQLKSVCSDVIKDKKAVGDLHIVRASHCSGPMRGGTQVILLCEKVTREDTAVVFYQEENGVRVWEKVANISHVHKQVAIVFETPPYSNPHHTDHVNVKFQLRRISDLSSSINSMCFEYIPEFQDIKKRKTVLKSLTSSTYEHERAYQRVKPELIKTEPNKSPLYSPPPQLPQYGDQQVWVPQGGMMPGPSHQGQFATDASWGPFGQSPQHQSPHPQRSPHPNAQLSPHPNAQLSPHPYSQPSPNPQLSPNAQYASRSPHQFAAQLVPTVDHMLATSPMRQPMSPDEVMSPEVVHQQQYQQAQHIYQIMDQEINEQISTPTISELLNAVTQAMPSGSNADALFSLSSMVEEPENLSDSLRMMSTSDLFPINRQ